MVNQKNAEHGDWEERRSCEILVVVFIYFVFATILAIVSWRGLVADGVGYFLDLLARPRPTTFERGRIFAHFIVQWPLVLALRAGVADVATLLYAHSFGLYYLGPLQLVFCYLIVPREKATDLVWPLISLFAGSMNAWFVAISESHVMTFIFWPLVLFMLHGRVEPRIPLIIFFILVGASLLSYESMALQGLVLTGFALWRFRQAARSAERILWLIVAGWFILGAAVAVQYILNPRDIINRDGLIMEMFRFIGTHTGNLNYPAILSITALGLIAYLFRVRPVGRMMFLSVMALFATAAVVVGFAPVLIPHSLRPGQQFSARAWIGVLPAGLAIAMIALRWQNAQWPAIAYARVLLVVGVLAFSQITWQILATAQWRGYIDVFRAELSQYKGFVPYERSPISHQPAGNQVIRNLGWAWTNPSMSIVLAPGGHVSTIFGAPPGRWQPFDPLNARELPKLAKYGVDYSTYLRTITSQ